MRLAMTLAATVAGVALVWWWTRRAPAARSRRDAIARIRAAERAETDTLAEFARRRQAQRAAQEKLDALHRRGGDGAA